MCVLAAYSKEVCVRLVAHYQQMSSRMSIYSWVHTEELLILEMDAYELLQM